MPKQSSYDTVKKERKKAFFLKEISQMIRKLSEDEPVLLDIFPTRVELSPGEGMCYVYFSSNTGKSGFDEALGTLILYKSSIRKAVSKIRQSRYTPDIKFCYDESFDKSQRVQELLDKASEELKKKT
ncbi:ribosome-binding factor A [Candidatus Babeliales bacterium]|nr:ribosome-binding factor A [Candidatus Babeliales bacterium]